MGAALPAVLEEFERVNCVPSGVKLLQHGSVAGNVPTMPVLAAAARLRWLGGLHAACALLSLTRNRG